jgi:hypothetical protein
MLSVSSRNPRWCKPRTSLPWLYTRPTPSRFPRVNALLCTLWWGWVVNYVSKRWVYIGTQGMKDLGKEKAGRKQQKKGWWGHYRVLYEYTRQSKLCRFFGPIQTRMMGDTHAGVETGGKPRRVREWDSRRGPNDWPSVRVLVPGRIFLCRWWACDHDSIGWHPHAHQRYTI